MVENELEEASPEAAAEEVSKEAHVLPGTAVDPVKVANTLGVQVYEVEFDNSALSGMVERTNDEFKIFVSSSLPSSYKRFVIAKELGHIVLDRKKAVAPRTAKPWSVKTVSPGLDVSTPVDTSSSQFATALLMPSETVRQVWQSVQSVDGVASWFQVPTEVSLPRLKSLGVLKR